MARAPDGRLESLVLLFAEKVVLAAVVPSLTLLAVNPMKFDSHQQASAAIALIAIGYFVAHSIERKSEAQKSPTVQSAPTPAPVKPIEPPSDSTAAPQLPPSQAATGTHPAPEPSLEFPGFHERVEKVSLSLGGFHAAIPLAGLRDKTFKGAAFKINEQTITPYLEGNHLYVDVSVYAGPGVPAVKIEKGNVTVSIPGWDRNSDNSAFEVVNEKGIPVFQMVYLTPSSIAIRGILVFSGGFMIAANENSSTMNPRNPFDFAPKRLFKYPSRLHPGEPAE